MDTKPTVSTPTPTPIPLYLEAAARWCRAAIGWRTNARVGFLGMRLPPKKRTQYLSLERMCWGALHKIRDNWPGQTFGGAR